MIFLTYVCQLDSRHTKPVARAPTATASELAGLFHEQLEHAVVLPASSDRGAQAVLEQVLVAAVADHDAAVRHLLVDCQRMRDLQQQQFESVTDHPDMSAGQCAALLTSNSTKFESDAYTARTNDSSWSFWVTRRFSFLMRFTLDRSSSRLLNAWRATCGECNHEMMHHSLHHLTSLTFAVSLLMLYGALTLLRIWISCGSPNALPRRMPASPKPFDSVCSTTSRRCLLTSVHRLGVSAKSMYASSTTTNPLYDCKCSGEHVSVVFPDSNVQHSPRSSGSSQCLPAAIHWPSGCRDCTGR